ncbi:Adenylate cyclase type 9 [Larimichthys crocea]|uniref:adenylate cyclase n=1 Tax=Larimichthys crocea TaxID=215358 RepID=A0A6G0HVE2_LARCR|nr:Adenylate cyclase type 9 [Larimichthys crocea]
MAAAGLNAQQCADAAHPHAHLRALFEFALEMMHVVDDFNKNMLGFGFKLRIGFNHGPLTAGVIGTTKLLYDIWGDTVNIASRMDTTGVECRVQVSEESYCVLSSMDYEFDYRGTVNVKGKGQMKTFLYPKSSDSGPVPQYQLSVSPEIRAQVDGSIGRSPTDEIASMVPTTSINASNTTSTVPSASVGSSTTTGLGHEREGDSHEKHASTETSHARQSTPHSGMTSIPVTNREGPTPSANNKQLVISSSVQQNTHQNSTSSQKDLKKAKCEDDYDSNVGELTRL